MTLNHKEYSPSYFQSHIDTYGDYSVWLIDTENKIRSIAFRTPSLALAYFIEGYLAKNIKEGNIKEVCADGRAYDGLEIVDERNPINNSYHSVDEILEVNRTAEQSWELIKSNREKGVLL